MGLDVAKGLAIFAAGIGVLVALSAATSFFSAVFSTPIGWVWNVTSSPRSFVVDLVSELGLWWSLALVAVVLIALFFLVRAVVGVALYLRVYGRKRAMRALKRLRKRDRGDPALDVAVRMLRHPTRPAILLLCVSLSAFLGLSAWLQNASLSILLSVAAVPLLVGVRALWPVLPHAARLVGTPLIGSVIGFFWFGARDVLFVAVTLGFVFGTIALIDSKRPAWWFIVGAAVSVALPWYGWSVFERASLSATAQNAAPAPRPSNPSFGLAFSGGGFRAALFHAGVLTELHSRGLVPAALSGVSGGAIFASYYATGGAPEQFVERVTRGQFNISREALTIYSLPRLLLSTSIPGADLQLWPIAFSRTELLAEQLDRAFLQGRQLTETRVPLLVGVSDARRGTAVGIWAGGALELPVRTVADRLVSDDHGCPPAMEELGDLTTLTKAPLSRLVATSASFPMAFPGISTGSRHLVDGGIADNTSAGLFVCAREASTESAPNPFNVERLIISDGGAVTSSEPSTLDWLDAIHRATGPFSVAPRSEIRRETTQLVSASQLIDAWRAYGAGNYKGERVEARISYELRRHFHEMLNACLQRACENGWMIGNTEFDTLATFMDRPQDMRCLQTLLQSWRGTKLGEEIGCGAQWGPTVRLAIAYGLARQMELLQDTFRKTPTLMAQFDGQTARRLFNFGRLVYILNGAQLPLTPKEPQ